MLGNDTLEFGDSERTIFVGLFVFVDKSSRSRGGLRLLAGRTVNQFLHLGRTKVFGLNSENKGQGVHNVTLPTPIRTNDGGKVLEGSDALFSSIGLEVFEF